MQFRPSFNWEVLDAAHTEEILRGLFASMTNSKVFRNIYLQQQQKEML